MVQRIAREILAKRKHWKVLLFYLMSGPGLFYLSLQTLVMFRGISGTFVSAHYYSQIQNLTITVQTVTDTMVTNVV